MSDIYDIKLEFLRTGPAHNQLLSPLTPYLALCGADAPVSVRIPLEHDKLLRRLDRLRYEVDGSAVSASQSTGELQELGETVARVLAEIPALVSELGNARNNASRLVNIRLVISAFELGLVPFEATMAPADTSGSGAHLLLSTPTTMTREVRRGRPLQFEWNRKPKILFAFASPRELAAVPAQEHLEALRRAIDPWIKVRESHKESLRDVREMLTVLPNATASEISEYCRKDDFTHVHILAHGVPMPRSEGRRFGLALSADEGGVGYSVVDGQSLAMALKGLKSSGLAKKPPTVVTLATCDSGNTGSVLTPGGSIAHELHASDIPWVIASQFPLWMRASSIAAECIYRGLLSGDDPRAVLYELRQRLRIDLPGTHDWVSIVAYATISDDLESKVDAFRSRQTKAKMEVMFARMDDLVAQNQSDEVKAELRKLCTDIRNDLKIWFNEPAAQRNPKERAERMGMRAASEKRIAIFLKQSGDVGGSTDAYRLSRDYYAAALKVEPENHWLMTQFLSVCATPDLATDAAELESTVKTYRRWWGVAWQLAQWKLANGTTADRVWAHGTLAEIELLRVVYEHEPVAAESAMEAIVEHCTRIRELSEDPFQIMSTTRQFQRYLDHWPREQWKDLAQAAIDALKRR
ncbi:MULTISPECIES: CHAT domain-containing protein [unclassified Variovorax]|nr:MULTISPECIES: CHAT domain-containing protein [unclassified Variovorax]